MTSIGRTAYPRFRASYSDAELRAEFALSATDHELAMGVARSDGVRLSFAALLVCRRRLGFFPSLGSVPSQVSSHLRQRLGFSHNTSLLDDEKRKKTLSGHREVIRDRIGAKVFDRTTAGQLDGILFEAAMTMSDPADLISRAVEWLRELDVDLPAFSRLRRIANSARARVHRRIFTTVAERINRETAEALNAMLTVPSTETVTPFNRLKHNAGAPNLRNLRAWADRLHWLDGLPTARPFLMELAPSKARQFASQARRMEVSELLDIRNPGKRHTLLLCFLESVRSRCRDELAAMFLRRIRRTVVAAREKLASQRDQHREIEDRLIGILRQTVVASGIEASDQAFGRYARGIFADHGGADTLEAHCDAALASRVNDELPFLWDIHRPHRTALFRLLDLLNIRSPTGDERLLDAWHLVQNHRAARRDGIATTVDLSFFPERWRDFILKSDAPGRATNGESGAMIDRRRLEIGVMVHLAQALECGDAFIEGSEEFADYRQQLLPWEVCAPEVEAYCRAIDLPAEPAAFAATLKDRLSIAAATVDASFPDNAELTIDPAGIPRLRKLPRSTRPPGLTAFERSIEARMPERHLLDILRDVEYWTSYTRHFGPPSGADPKLADATRRYLFTVFGYGCNLGPSQTARHAPDQITRQNLRRINASHVTAGKLEAAGVDIINAYARFDLPKFWGDGSAAIADGTHALLRDNNLTRSRHFRYGKLGGVAYNHIANSYIALFTTFIPCGVWEAVHILDGLLNNKSDIQPDIVHADTQGQSEPVFGLALMLAVTLMPRMRNWADVILYRPDAAMKYEHIDELFSATIDWKLIETHWRDVMQVVLSIRAGKVTPSMLLRRLNSQNRKNRLYRALREIGRVERTIFLLRYLSDVEIRRSIRAETTKIESFNDFLDWLSFGGPVIKSGDPVEHDKQIRYANLVANAVMLRNVADLTEVIAEMDRDGEPASPELAATISPYIRNHIRRFGRLDVDMAITPKPLAPSKLPFQIPM